MKNQVDPDHVDDPFPIDESSPLLDPIVAREYVATFSRPIDTASDELKGGGLVLQKLARYVGEEMIGLALISALMEHATALTEDAGAERRRIIKELALLSGISPEGFARLQHRVREERHKQVAGEAPASAADSI